MLRNESQGLLLCVAAGLSQGRAACGGPAQAFPSPGASPRRWMT